VLSDECVVVVMSGRTMEFVFDQTQIPIIGSKYWDIVSKQGVTADTPAGDTTVTGAVTGAAAASNSGTGSRTTTTTASDNVSSWKRPASSQVRCDV